MTVTDTLWLMSTQRMTTRQVAGSIVRDEMARQGLRQERTAELAKMSRSTLSRVLEGADNVQDVTFRQVEGVLGMPRRFLTFIVDADVTRIAAIEGMDADLKRHALDVLSGMGGSVKERRPRRA